MKQKKFNRKLLLNKQTIAHLNRSRMENIKGGTVITIWRITIEDDCWTQVVNWCISDPPTGCLGCPQSEINPDQCPVPGEVVPVN